MTKACAQCCQVKGKCSLVKKVPAATSTPTKAHKRPRVGEAGSSRASEVREKEAMVADEAGSWGAKVCEGIATLSGSLNGLTEMVRHQNVILGCLAGMLEEEVAWARWRWKTQGELVVTLAVILGEGDEEEEEVEEEAGNKGENEEDIE